MMSSNAKPFVLPSSVDGALETMRRHLQGHAGLQRVAEHWNGFEGWLKFELASALRHAHGGVPWVGTDYGDIGVEYRYERGPKKGNPEHRKLIDLWLGNNPTYYFELKAVFNNKNRGKQLRSWQLDFEKLAAVLSGDREVAGYAAVLVAVGYDKNAWKDVLDELTDTGAFWEGATVSTGDAGDIRLCALRNQGPSRA